MDFSLDQRTASLSVGEFSQFTLGPHDTGGGTSGVWRAQLGTHWHNELRAQATADHAAAAEFEIAITGKIFHRGWTLALTGRIDQLIRSADLLTLREIKTVTRPLPADETELRTDYPEYFVQLATYAALHRLVPPSPPTALRPELVFVEVGSGLSQTIALTPADDGLFRAQLDRIVEFLGLRLRARERLRDLRFRPPFASPRPGQETTRADLTALFERSPLVLFEAPTGFGKTGVLLEFALGQLRSGHFDRALYLTSKSTGQLQVVRTLAAMIDGDGGTPVAAWHVRNKSEHCVNHTFHCVRESCAYLDNLAARWPASGLARFYLDEHHARDLDTLRAAGRDARICPYEITRAALAFNDLWVGDYNYVFAPRNRGLFFNQPGFTPARTLLLLDEAHNLPARVADACSHAFTAADAFAVREELHRLRPSAALVTAWDHWCHCLQHLRAADILPGGNEDDARHLLDQLAKLIPTVPLDYAALGPHAAELLWQIPTLVEELNASDLPRLWWCPRDAELALTCLDAAGAIGRTLREFGGVVLASATITPTDGFAAACGLSSSSLDATPPTPSAATPPPSAQSAFRNPQSAIRDPQSEIPAVLLRAATPWRDLAYDLAVDARVDTTFQHRSRHYATTAATIAALHESARVSLATQTSPPDTATPCVAVFFPSYAYAEVIAQELARVAPGMRAALQPKLRDLAAQTAWVDESLLLADALFLVLGSSFAESIDALGGRIGHAMVVGPALPEVNAVQRARLAEATRAGLTREQAFRRVYQIPGMTKVNQALGRLVRAPGQHARVLLHCQRFLEPSYASLLAAEYQFGLNLLDDDDLSAWLAV